MTQYRKFLVALAGAILTFLNQILAVVPEKDKVLVTIVIAFVTAFLVYLAPNTP